MTSSEFYSVSYGHSIDHVRKTFGNNGKVVDRYDGAGTRYDSVTLEFPTYYEEGSVRVLFGKNAKGAWVLDSKAAYWGVSATRTANKATPTEFGKLKEGHSLDYVRSTFGTAGTITYYYDRPGTKYDNVTVEWPTDSVDGAVSIDFVKSTSGVWKLDSRSAYWAIEPAQTANKATPAEFAKVQVGNSLAYAQSTFGTAGTITYYYDATGTKYDTVTIEWPTDSPYGYVSLDFKKSSAGTWKVSDSYAFWG
ncbi:hypothetical protein Slu03_04680 [Sediminihabitans luteus]|nr:hypothetical protein Slu03_04680 [Sediminihabitans luteus]